MKIEADLAAQINIAHQKQGYRDGKLDSTIEEQFQLVRFISSYMERQSLDDENPYDRGLSDTCVALIQFAERRAYKGFCAHYDLSPDEDDSRKQYLKHIDQLHSRRRRLANENRTERKRNKSSCQFAKSCIRDAGRTRLQPGQH